MKKIITVICILSILLLTGCQGQSSSHENKSFNIGICNYVDDASLNQIVENIQLRLGELAKQNGLSINIKLENCNADANVLNQIIANFENMDLMVAVASPVAIAMKNAMEDSGKPVVFAAVSDPVASGIVDSMEKPGANITGTSDYLDTDAIMNLMFALDPDLNKVGLLYDMGQDSSTTAIAMAKAYLNNKNVEIVEKTGTNVSEIMLAADALISEGCKVIFTPSDNTVMTAELSIYEKLAANGVKHYAGADSFALNGAFLGYGVDYANLGKETAEMVYEILVEGKKPAETAVRNFDNGLATVNTEICEQLGLNFDEVKNTIAPFCNQVLPITTAEEF